MKLTRAAVLYLVIADRTVQAQALRAGVVLWAGEATYQSSDDLAEVIAQLAAAPSERCRRLRVTVGRPPAQTRTLSNLPPVRPPELRALVANQAGRFFRRNGAALVTDAAWVANGKGRVTQAVAVEEPLLLAVMAGAAEAGLIVDSIAAAGVSPELQLFPASERAVRARTNRRTVHRLALAVGVAWTVAIGVVTARLVIERRAIDAELAAAATPLAALTDVRREMRAAETMARQLADARHERGRALASLARLSAVIPDSAVLTAYTWRSDGSGIVAGAGRRAADVLSAVDRANVVTKPRIEGAVVREALGGHEWERFTIVFGASTP